MKNFKTFESFIAKEINENFVEIPNLSDVDHTRVVKWMSQNLENDYSIKKMGKGYRIDVHKLSKNEFDDLIGYLQSQNYLEESKMNESKIKPFKQVKVGDKATDYNGDTWKVLAKGKVKDLKKYDDSGATEELDPNEEAIALDGRGGTAVFSYDEAGAVVYESLNESEDATPYLDEVKAALPDLEDLIKKELGFKPKLDVKASRGRLEITSGDIINELGKTLVKTMFVEVTIGFWGGNVTKDGKTIWFNPKLWYKHPSGGTNGTDFVWDSLWYDLEKKEWITGRSFV